MSIGGWKRRKSMVHIPIGKEVVVVGIVILASRIGVHVTVVALAKETSPSNAINKHGAQVPKDGGGGEGEEGLVDATDIDPRGSPPVCSCTRGEDGARHCIAEHC